jgi:hypothetical protein
VAEAGWLGLAQGGWGSSVCEGEVGLGLLGCVGLRAEGGDPCGSCCKLDGALALGAARGERTGDKRTEGKDAAEGTEDGAGV